MNAPELQQLAAQLLVGANASDPSNTAPPPVVIPDAAPAPVAPVMASNMPITANAVAPADGTVNASVQQSMPVPATPEEIAAAQQAAQTTAGDGLPLTPQQAATRHAGVVAQDLPAMDQNVAGKFSGNRKEIANAADETKEAAAETTAAKINEQHAADSGLNDLAAIAASDLKAKQEAETWKINTTNEVMAADKFVREESLKLAQRNPEDLWGNATTGGKIAGVLGIVAAGLSHPGGATERLTQMVNDSVAAQANKLKYLKAYGEANHNLLANAESVFASREAAHESVKAAMLQQVAVKVQQAIAGTKDQTALAMLHETLANVDMKQAEANQKSMQIEMGLRVGLAAQTAGLEKAQMSANARAQAGQRNIVTISGLVNEDGSEAQLDGKSPNVRKLADAMNNAAAFISRGEKIKDVLLKARKVGKSDPHYAELLGEYNALAQNLQGPYKQFYNYGAAFTGGEKAPLLSMLSALPTQALNFDFLNDISDAKLNTGINIIKDDARKTAVGLSGNAHVHLDLSHPFYHAEPNADAPTMQTAQRLNSGSQADWDATFGNMPEQ